VGSWIALNCAAILLLRKQKQQLPIRTLNGYGVAPFTGGMLLAFAMLPLGHCNELILDER